MTSNIALTLFTSAIVLFATQAQAGAETNPRASKIAGAVPINPAGWATSKDRDRSGSDGEGITRFALTVSATGQVEDCTVTESSKFVVLDELTCSLMKSRGRFEPAKDQNGEPIASFYENSITWVRPGRSLKASGTPAHLSITLKRLPDGVRSPAQIRVLTVVGPDGKVEACEGQGKERLAVFNTIACAQLGTQVPDLIVQDHSGTPRRALRNLLVEFNAN